MDKPHEHTVAFPASDGRPREAVVTVAGEDGGSRPAVLILHGLAGVPPAEPIEPLLARALAGHGHVAVHYEPRHFHAERDEEVDREMELADASGALECTARLPGVDPDRIFILGLSMGGMAAPFAARAVGCVRGIAAWGSTARPWGEYMADNVRRQLGWAGWDPDRIEKLARCALRWCSLLETTERQGEELVAGLEGARKLGITASGRGGRSVRFWRQVVRTDAASSYLGLECAVLSVRGSADCASHPEDHRSIIEASRSAGLEISGAVLDGLDHGLRPCPSPEDSYRRRCEGPADAGALARIFTAWAARMAP